jgi:preprotein translocase subunit SecG
VPILILADWIHGLLGLILTVMAVFIILLVLVQRGRGGGLAGALGGMGGSSAFGAKAGDVFTRITIGAAAIWIVLCIGAAKWGAAGGSSLVNVGNRTAITNKETMEPAKEAGKGNAAASAPAKSEPAASTTVPAKESSAPAGTPPTGGATGSAPSPGSNEPK